MKELLLCSLITVGFLVVLYIWGKAFLTAIHGETGICDSILFGFAVIHVIFQVFYLPFLLTRGSFRSLAIIWTIVSFIFTLALIIYLKRKTIKTRDTLKNISFRDTIHRLSTAQIISFTLVVAMNLFLCWYIGCRPRHNGVDTIQYIQRMNEMVYRGYLWNNGNTLEIHQGLNSFYSLFAIISWITGVRPLYINCFTMRFLGIIFSSMLAYRFGRIAFGKKNGVYPMAVAVIVPTAMMVWNSDYATGMFFYERTNESKAFCQFMLFPLAVSILVQMFQEGNDRKPLWKEQIIIGLSAVPIAVSSMTIYPALMFVGLVGLLVYDRFKGAGRTVLKSFLCVLPNILYIGFYVLYQKQILRF